MKNSIRKKIKQEKAAVTLLVFVTVLTFVAVLMGAYLTVTTLKKSQLQSDIRIQEIYGKDVERVDEIYEELTSKDRQGPSCDITYTINENINITYKFIFDENVKGFESSDLKLYSGSSISTDIQSQFTLSTSSPTYAATLTTGKTYVISFDYQCITDSQEFEFGLYSETETNLPIKKLSATKELNHEDYIINVDSTTAQFKILAQVKESNDINISNFQIIELNNEEVAKGAFVKNNDTTYTLVAEYDETLKYVLVIDENAYTDLSENGNKKIIKVI